MFADVLGCGRITRRDDAALRGLQFLPDAQEPLRDGSSGERNYRPHLECERITAMTKRSFMLTLAGMAFMVLAGFAWLCLYCSFRFTSPMKYVCVVLVALFLYPMTRLFQFMVATVKDIWYNPNF
jgi:hypothetical protein